MRFKDAIDHVLRFEGGYVFDLRDPGGETNYGISKRAHPNIDIKNLTEESAKNIYRFHYWEMIDADSLPKQIRLLMFDAAVNLGVKRSIRLLQRALRIHVDGIIGVKTLRKVNTVDVTKLREGLLYQRIMFYTRLKTFPIFGKGWIKRVVELSQIY